MSLAKVNEIKRVRKPGTCEKCGLEIKVGDPAIRFAVGFRGYVRTRCTKRECYPRPSERESSLVADVYAAQEEVDVSGAGSLEDLETIREEVVEVVREVAGQYEDSEMFDKNYDLQERADQLNTAADDLENWEPVNEEPTPDDEEWTLGDTKYDNFEDAYEAWLSEARDSLDAAINEMELP